MFFVSAVITTHKRSPEIVERAIKSVLSQTWERMELIVVDDSPADFAQRADVRRMVEGYATQNVRYIAHERCMGACAARNTGTEHALGEFIAFLDDDDEWKPNKIERQMSAFTDESIALVYCGREIKNDTTGSVTPSPFRGLSGRVYPELIKQNFIGSTSFPLLRKSVLEAVGGFDVLMEASQDFDVWLRIAKEYDVAFVEESLVVYHIHDGERITSNYARKINGWERLNEKNADYLAAHRDARHIRLMLLTPFYAGNKQLGKALRTWFRAAWLRPFAVKTNLRYLYRILKNR
jgi:glycosyltransferase involved in cell wall biosynthesis